MVPMNNPTPSEGFLVYPSQTSVAETVRLIQAAAGSKGVEVFAVIDHAAGARSVGLEMPETQVVILGNPKAGTQLMLQAPALAIDLPIRVLVRAKPPGSEVLLHDPHLVASRYGLGDEQAEVLAGIARLVQAALAG